jgi:hypothetical protein
MSSYEFPEIHPVVVPLGLSHFSNNPLMFETSPPNYTATNDFSQGLLASDTHLMTGCLQVLPQGKQRLPLATGANGEHHGFYARIRSMKL